MSTIYSYLDPNPSKWPALVKQTRAPTSTDTGHPLGTPWLYTTHRQIYILSSKAGGVATWTLINGSFDFYPSVISQTTEAAAVQTQGNRYIASANGATWVINNIYEWSSGAWAKTTVDAGALCYDEDGSEYLLFDGAVWNSLIAGITTFAGLTDTNIVAPASGELPIYDGVNSWDNKAVSGVITMTNLGVTAFSGTPVINAVVDAAAAIDYSKLAALTSANILVGSAANVATVTTVTGDMAITNAGVTTVTDLTIAGEAQGDILYFDGSGWEGLVAGAAGLSLLTAGAAANPYWGTPSVASASSLANGCVLNDAGAFDALFAFTTQTVGAPTLTIPDFASVSDTFVFTTLAQTLVNKTLTSPVINTANIDGGTIDSLTNFSIRSSGAAFDLEQDTAEVLTGNKIISWNVADTNRSITLGGNLVLGGTLTTLAAWTQVGANTIQLTTTGATTLTLPTTGTLITLAGTETLSNKTLTAPKIVTTDGIFDGGGDEFIIFTESATPVNYLGIHSADTGVAPVLCGEGSDANVPLALYGKGTGKVTIEDAATPTKMLNFELVGATATKTMTIVSSHTDDRTLTLPDATDTLVGKATTDVLTEKSIDANGSGNVITNINGAELEDAAATTALGMAIPFIVKKDISNALTTVLYNANFPQKARLIKAWVVESAAANSGNVQIDDGTNPICAAENYTGTDTKVVDFTTIDDGTSTLAANATLRAVNSVNTDDAMLYTLWIPIA